MPNAANQVRSHSPHDRHAYSCPPHAQVLLGENAMGTQWTLLRVCATHTQASICAAVVQATWCSYQNTFPPRHVAPTFPTARSRAFRLPLSLQSFASGDVEDISGLASLQPPSNELLQHQQFLSLLSTERIRLLGRRGRRRNRRRSRLCSLSRLSRCDMLYYLSRCFSLLWASCISMLTSSICVTV